MNLQVLTLEQICNTIKDIDCNDCIHLNIIEDEQSKDKELHICTFYNKRVKHMDCEKYLYGCIECKTNDFGNYKYRCKDGLYEEKEEIS